MMMKVLQAFLLEYTVFFKSMKDLGDKINYHNVVEKVLISLTQSFDSKVSSIKKTKDFNNITIEKLHGMLTTYEMRERGTLGIREVELKSTNEGKEK